MENLFRMEGKRNAEKLSRGVGAVLSARDGNLRDDHGPTLIWHER